MHRILVVGGAAIDYVIHAEVLPSAGDSVTGNTFLRDCGGKGFNQAVAAARLGAPVGLVAAVGADDAGGEVLYALRDEGVKPDTVVRVARRTSRTLLTIDAQGQKQSAAYPGANAEFDAAWLDARTISEATIVLAQLEIPLDAVLSAAQRTRDAGARFLLDAAPATEVSDDLLSLAHVVLCNRGEAEALSGTRVESRDTAFAAADAIRKRGAANVTIGLADGRAVLSDGTCEWLPAIDVKVVDTTGGGDACAAAIAVALLEGRSVLDACKFGHAASALAITRLGARASLPLRADVDALLRT